MTRMAPALGRNGKMFSNLVESSSHHNELARKGRFFLATLIGYSLIVLCAGVASIYAYDAHLENQNLEFIALISPDQTEQVSPVIKNARPKASTNPGEKSTNAQRPMLIDRIAESTKIPEQVSAIKSSVPEIPRGGKVDIGSQILEATGGPPGNHNSDGEPGGNGSAPGTVVKIDTPPPPLKDKPVKPATPAVVRTSKLLNGQATYLPKPAYPQIAKQIRAAGPVNVQLLIDETGKVLSARATSGHPTLHAAAVQAAYQARFSPTMLNGVAVKVSGIITYNFVMQ
jgi:TonB family protein